MNIDAIARAVRSAEAMWSADNASKWAGFELTAVGPGTASVTVTISDNHLNGQGACHGGVVFMLADTAFGYACNSYNQKVVGQMGTVNFVRPGALGEELVAEAVEVSRQGRSGLYDVTVMVAESRDIVAQFRGSSRMVKGTHFEEGVVDLGRLAAGE